MRDDFEKALAEEFPFMRRDPAGEQEKQCGGAPTAYSMWGLEMDEGWYPLVRELCAEITEAYRAAGEPVDLVVDQVKEKWGSLRFCWRPRERDAAAPAVKEAHQRVDELIARYEERSTHVCELCGKPGSLRKNPGRVKTMCDEHQQRYMERWNRRRAP